MSASEATVCVVDDDLSAREGIVGVVRAAGFAAVGFTSAADFLAHAQMPTIRCLVLDVEMPELTGLDLQEQLNASGMVPPIIFVTGHGDVHRSVRAIKAGAVDFLVKPLDACALVDAIRRVLARSEPARRGGAMHGIVGSSPALKAVLHEIETVARTDATILLHGETGTGKECLARALHDLSDRRAGRFVKVNCAAIPSGLLESELMGHERGAFTGAVAQRVGRFELAQDGTIFLDEVGELPLDLQPKLLRVLQEREFERLGGTLTIRSNARIVTATNRNLKAMVAARTFREDLYYRLSVFPITVPPLRERASDIPVLARHFVAEVSRRLGRSAAELSETALARLARHTWPGNIRELQNVIERSVILAEGAALEVPAELAALDAAYELSPPAPAAPLDDNERFDITAFILGLLAAPSEGEVYAETHRRVDRTLFTLALKYTRGNQRAAARLVGISRQTMRVRLRSLGLHVARSVESDDQLDEHDPSG